MLAIQISIVIVLFAIFIQDLRYRAVYWFWFPALTGLFIVLGLPHRSLENIKGSSLINMGMISVVLLLLIAYLSIRRKRLVNITRGMLCLGDILFLFSICFYLSVLNYLVFYMLSMLIILLVWLPFLLFNKRNLKVPLAGMQSLLFAACLVLSWFSPRIDLVHDDWLIPYLIYSK